MIKDRLRLLFEVLLDSIDRGYVAHQYFGQISTAESMYRYNAKSTPTCTFQASALSEIEVYT